MQEKKLIDLNVKNRLNSLNQVEPTFYSGVKQNFYERVPFLSQVSVAVVS